MRKKIWIIAAALALGGVAYALQKVSAMDLSGAAGTIGILLNKNQKICLNVGCTQYIVGGASTVTVAGGLNQSSNGSTTGNYYVSGTLTADGGVVVANALTVNSGLSTLTGGAVVGASGATTTAIKTASAAFDFGAMNPGACVLSPGIVVAGAPVGTSYCQVAPTAGATVPLGATGSVSLGCYVVDGGLAKIQGCCQSNDAGWVCPANDAGYSIRVSY